MRFRDRRLWLEVQTQKDARVQARTGGKDADGCEVQGWKVLVGCTDTEGCGVQALRGNTKHRGWRSSGQRCCRGVKIKRGVTADVQRGRRK